VTRNTKPTLVKLARGHERNDDDFAAWLIENPEPSLADLIDRAGRRHAASIGETYDENPFTRPPHQGRYQHITAAEWAEFDRAMAHWQRRRRERYGGEFSTQYLNAFRKLRDDVARRARSPPVRSRRQLDSKDTNTGDTFDEQASRETRRGLSTGGSN
jgi:hypothetical protein